MKRIYFQARFGRRIQVFAVTRTWATLFLLAATCLTVRAQETNSASRLEYPSFRIISERNIFSPNRSNRRSRSGGSEPRVRIESFTLVGTLSYEKGSFAFFEGTSSQYRQVLKPADAIAGYKIVDIAPEGIKLEANGQNVELRVGMQMKREDEGEWQVAMRTEASPDTSRSTASVEKSDDSGAGSGGEESDVLKRLMQKREQETGGKE